MSFMWFFAGIFIGIALLWLLQRFGWKKKATDGSPDFSVIEQRLSGIESKLKALLEIRGDMKESQGADRVVSPVIKPEESPVREQKQGKPAPPVSLEKEPVRDEKPGKLKEKKYLHRLYKSKKRFQGKWRCQQFLLLLHVSKVQKNELLLRKFCQILWFAPWHGTHRNRRLCPGRQLQGFPLRQKLPS